MFSKIKDCDIDVQLIPNSVTAASSQTNDVWTLNIRMYQAPNSPGTVTWSTVDSNYSVAQVGMTISGFTTGNSILLYSQMISGRGSADFSSFSDVFTSPLISVTSNYADVSDIVVVTLYQNNGNGTPYGTLNWNEIY